MIQRLTIRVASINPVLDRELRQRSRSGRSVIVLTLFLGALIGVTALSYLAVTESTKYSGNPIQSMSQDTGVQVFEILLLVEMLMLLLIIPALSAASVTSERDRQTLIPLQVTLVGPAGIFLGKVAASAGFVLLIMIASAPVLAIPFILGGLSLSTVLTSLLCLLAIGVLLAAIGVACSCIFRRTQVATLAAFAAVLALVLGSLFLTAATALIDAARGTDTVEPRDWGLYFNPIVALADVAGESNQTSSGPLGSIRDGVLELQYASNPDVEVFGGRVFNRQTGDRIEPDRGWRSIPVWVISLGYISTVTVALSYWAVRKLRAPYREIPT